MNTSKDNIQEACERIDAATNEQSNQTYPRNEMEFSVVLRVENVKESIQYYCHAFGFLFERLETKGRFLMRAYLKPFENANTYVCLEQFIFPCADAERKPKMYIEIMPGRAPMDYEDYCNELHYDRGVQFEYDYAITRAPISVLKDPDEHPIWIQDVFEYDFE